MSGLKADLGLSRGDFTLGIAFAVDPGATVALLGPNGAGKTTAVDLLAGLAALESGRIELNDRVLDEANTGTFVRPHERKIGVVFQDHTLFPHLNALDNAAFGVRSRGHGRTAARAVAHEWLVRLGVPDVAELAPGDLSGGESQRVALARALAMAPDLLLLDEPFAALDASSRVAARRLLIEHLRDFESPTVLITHDPSEAFLLADVIHVIEDGSITQTGTSEQIRTSPKTGYIADLVGVNLLTGDARNGDVTIGGHHIRSGDTATTGPVVVTIHPRAISVHRTQPEGSARNSWETTVARSEHYGDRVRLQFGVPIDLTAEITPEAEAALSLEVGSVVWLSIKATEVDLRPR